jgi:hypothetical protein
MLGGMTGFGGTTLPCCYKSHLILMSISIFGTAVFCLCMFGQVHSPALDCSSSFRAQKISSDSPCFPILISPSFVLSEAESCGKLQEHEVFRSHCKRLCIYTSLSSHSVMDVSITLEFKLSVPFNQCIEEYLISLLDFGYGRWISTYLQLAGCMSLSSLLRYAFISLPQL